MDDTTSFSLEEALAVTMIAMAAVDVQVKETELASITRIINTMPIFKGFSTDRIDGLANIVFDFYGLEDGLDLLFASVKSSLPPHLFETAYAFCCDVAAADGKLTQSELILLRTIRHEFHISRLNSAAIEHGARVRHMQGNAP